MTFEETPTPAFLTVPWNMAKIGSSLFFTWADLNNDQKNVPVIEKSAKAAGVSILAEYSPDGVRLHVEDIKAPKGKKDSAEHYSHLLERINALEQPTVPAIYKTLGDCGINSRNRLLGVLKEMEEKGLIQGKPFNGPVGRPTTIYKIVQTNCLNN